MGLVMVAMFALAVSCTKKEAISPVDRYIEILDEATRKTEAISSMDELINFQDIISPQEAFDLVKENADYKLTDKDKDKLKKSFDKLLKVAYEKTADLGGFPEEIKKQTKAQGDLFIEAANKRIDEAATLGELNGIR